MESAEACQELLGLLTKYKVEGREFYQHAFNKAQPEENARVLAAFQDADEAYNHALDLLSESWADFAYEVGIFGADNDIGKMVGILHSCSIGTSAVTKHLNGENALPIARFYARRSLAKNTDPILSIARSPAVLELLKQPITLDGPQ